MDFQKILDTYSLGDFPAGLTGCRSDGTSHEFCEYDLTVFDERDELDTVIEYDDSFVCIRHRSLSSPRSPDMVRYENMKIISDASWDLHMLLSRISEKRTELYADYMRDSLIDSMFCTTKFREGIKTSDPFAICWIKCAALYMADAALLSCMHIGTALECLHPHADMRESAPYFSTWGVIEVPLWVPSHTGPSFESPHIQYAIVSPALMFITTGLPVHSGMQCFCTFSI